MPRPLSSSVDVHVGVDRTYAVLTGPEWPAALEAQLHDGSEVVRAEPTEGGGALVVLSRRLPEGVPGPLQRFAPADGRVVQTDHWDPAVDGVRRGTWEVTFAGSPGTISGQHLLEPAPGGARWTVTGQVQVRIPLLGGQVEGFLAPLLEKLVARQGEVLRTLLD